MRILAIETATAACSVAIGIGDEVFERATDPDAAKPSEQVPKLIERLLAELGLGVASLDLIAFDMGPGAFTGIRIGCGLAQGMALAAELPVIGLCSLRVLALQAPEGEVLAALDARMGEVYWAQYRRGSVGGRPTAVALGDPQVEAPALLRCPTDIGFALGDGLGVAVSPAVDGDLAGTSGEAVALFERLPACVRVVDPRARPRAADMVPLALSDNEVGLALPAEAVSPLYVRDKVALTAAEQLARRSAR